VSAAVAFVAAPLTARSGVYRSTIELVVEARRQGLAWCAFLGVSRSAAGTPAQHDGVREVTLEPAGPRGVLGLRESILADPGVGASDLVITMTPQADMALALTRRPWIAYLRGLPWPDTGEASAPRRHAWRALERRALRRAIEVWATTTTLAQQVMPDVQPLLVPPGIRPLQRVSDGSSGSDEVVWAARFDLDKRPELFADIMSGVPGLKGTMLGDGPLRHAMEARVSPNVALLGWGDPSRHWASALAYVGTSAREAFGRSAVEAAMAGVPVVLSSAFGAAPLLYTDPALYGRFVLDSSDTQRWRECLRDLAADRGLRMAVSDHVHENASRLAIDRAVDRVAQRVGELRP
jgi:glycosyltransferase involved in cell wall biosynthesis